jgi:hypothetical protein
MSRGCYTEATIPRTSRIASQYSVLRYLHQRVRAIQIYFFKYLFKSLRYNVLFINGNDTGLEQK